jgi:thioredoxin 1
MSPNCIEVTSPEDFTERLAAAGDTPVLVDFWATWCGPCVRFASTLEQIAEERAGDLVVLKVNVDDVDGLAATWKIATLPTFMLFKKSVSISSVSGASKEKVIAMLTE